MSTPIQITANAATTQFSPEPRAENDQSTNQSTSCKNTTPGQGLFAFHDFIRPGEELLYEELDAALRQDLAPSGLLEYNLTDEIRRAMWRLRRCGQVEESFALPGIATAAVLPDPMQSETTARLQNDIDRARSQAHRLLHKCTAELRRLQTDRKYRDESFEAGTDISSHGLCDWRSVSKGLDEKIAADYRRDKLAGMAEIAAILDTPMPSPAQLGSFCKNDFTPTQRPFPSAATPRNARCPCGSGLKHKRCCGKNAPAILHAA